MNHEGKPIAGVPDSYVGPTAQTCAIAAEYTTYKPDRLAPKLRADYHDVVARCPNARRIFLCTNRPRNAALENELVSAAASDGRELRVVWGDELARTVDDQRQDLRLEHLGIPVGTLTRFSLQPALRLRLEESLRGFLGPSRRSELAGHVHRPYLRSEFQRLRETPGTTLLTGDAGMGKTTWSAATALRWADRMPVVWQPARSVTHLDEAICAAAYGTHTPGHLHELRSLLVTERRVLLAFVDGIDEYPDYLQLADVLEQFRAGQLAPYTHLVLTCRTEAVAILEGLASHVLPRAHHPNSRRLNLPPLNWTQSERLLKRLNASPATLMRVRRTLPERLSGNPLYLRHALEVEFDSLEVGAADSSEATTWVDAIARHIVCKTALRLRRHLGHGAPDASEILEAFSALALRVAVKPEGVKAEDVGHRLLTSRNSESSLVVQAVQGGLLERNGTLVRFPHALFCEYFCAHAVIDAHEDAEQLVRRVASLPAPTSIARFVSALDPSSAKGFVTHAPELATRLDPTTMDATTVASLLDQGFHLLGSESPARRRAGVRIVSALRSSDAASAAAAWFNALSPRERGFRAWDAAEVFLRQQYVPAAHVVLQHWTLRGSGEFVWYDPEFNRAVVDVGVPFRDALTSAARKRLESSRIAEDEVARATAMLAYLLDPWLLEHLVAKSHSGALQPHEHRALAHFNSDEAMDAYLRSVSHYYGAIDEIPPDEDEGNIRRGVLWTRLQLNGSDIRRFEHDAVLRLIRRLLRGSAGNRHENLGLALADRFPDASLIDPYAAVVERRHAEGRLPFHDQMIRRMAENLAPNELIELYGHVSQNRAKRDLLYAAGASSGEEIETLLLDALEEEPLYGAACLGLARFGSQRAGEMIHSHLANADGNYLDLTVKALGRLQYAPALDDLIARLNPSTEPNLAWTLIVAIGLIGGEEACEALERAYEQTTARQLVLSALLDVERAPAQQTVHRILSHDAGAKHLLGGALSQLELLRKDEVYPVEEGSPSRRDEVVLDALVTAAQEKLKQLRSDKPASLWEDCRAIALFASPRADAYFRELAETDTQGVAGGLADAVEFSRRILAGRGDESWARYQVAKELDEIGQRLFRHPMAVERLERWPRHLVQRELRSRLAANPETWGPVLARFADSDDIDALRGILGAVSPGAADQIRSALPQGDGTVGRGPDDDSPRLV